MSQNRKAPAYQEYAANILAQLPFGTITLQDRGLLWTLRMECWVNKRLPNNSEVIARALGLPVDEVAASLPAVMPFFKILDDFIICPELEDYRSYLEERKRRQSEGGKTGIIITNEKRKASKNKTNDQTTTSTSTLLSNSSTTLPSNLQVPLQGTDKSLVQYSPVQLSIEKLSTTPSLKKEVLKDPFVSEMEEYEASERNDSMKNVKKVFMRI